jgi:hypothetical protein
VTKFSGVSLTIKLTSKGRSNGQEIGIMPTQTLLRYPFEWMMTTAMLVIDWKPSQKRVPRRISNLPQTTSLL